MGRVSTGVRKRVQTGLARLSRAADPAVWQPQANNLGLLYRRRRRVVFRDLDGLAGLLKEMTSVNGGGFSVNPSGGNRAYSSDMADEAATGIAHLAAPAYRTAITMGGQRPPNEAGETPQEKAGGLWWDLRLTVDPKNRRGTEFQVHGIGREAEAIATNMMKLVDQHTIPAPRRLKHRREPVVLVEPITLEDSAQHAHDRALARSSARRGAIWGGAVGFVFSSGLQLLVALNS